MNLQVFTGVVFCLVYLYIVFSSRYLAVVLWLGIAALAIVPPLISGNPLFWPADFVSLDERGSWASINWNVMGIFAGTLLVAEVFIYSRVPAVLSDWLIAKSPNVCWALLAVCFISSFISIFAANVATVLIVAPVAIELARKLNVSPAPFLIGIAIASNLQGTATLIGDPPSMILAARYGMNFNDFFWYQGRLGIFFAVQAGAVASFIVLWFLFNRYKQPVMDVPVPRPRSWFPSVILVVMIGALAMGSWVDPNFVWFGGMACMATGFIAMVWLYTRDSRVALRILKGYDWDTTFFLAGVFMMVFALVKTRIVDAAAAWVHGVTGDSVLVAFILIVTFSLVVSAMVDNVPYIAAMLPLVTKLGESLGIGDNMVLAYGLLIGSCLGGNITPVGASANVVACGMLRRMGEDTSFWKFIKIGFPFTIAATAAGSLLVWLICM